MAEIVKTVLTKLLSGSDFVLNSQYYLKWTGNNCNSLNTYNDYVESINVPGRTIATSDSRTGNSIVSKIASDITVEDVEIVWRMPQISDTSQGNSLYALLENWMAAAKEVSDDGSIFTGFFDDYCRANSLDIGYLKNPNNKPEVMAYVRGIYPTGLQNIQFSSEGGDYIKITATFYCDRLNPKGKR
jgi:hypothetical protein